MDLDSTSRSGPWSRHPPASRRAWPTQKGSALSHLDRAASVYGHDRLHKSMENFCDRWSDGIDILTKDAEAIGDVLGKVAHAYRAADQASAGRLTTDPGKPVVDD